MWALHQAFIFFPYIFKEQDVPAEELILSQAVQAAVRLTVTVERAAAINHRPMKIDNEIILSHISLRYVDNYKLNVLTEQCMITFIMPLS